MSSSSSSLTLFFTFILLSSTISINGENSDWFIETKVLEKMVEKISHLHFYFHDTVSGGNPTAKQIVGPKGIPGFGTMMIADDPLTEGPEPTSKVIGRAQGVYAIASQQETGLLMVINYCFMDGKYNGSTLSVLGRNPVFHPVREMPIVGGSGLFRFARGYALAKTVWFNMKGDAVVEYNVTVIHY